MTVATNSFTSTNLGFDGTHDRPAESFDTEHSSPKLLRDQSENYFSSWTSIPDHLTKATEMATIPKNAGATEMPVVEETAKPRTKRSLWEVSLDRIEQKSKRGAQTVTPPDSVAKPSLKRSFTSLQSACSETNSPSQQMSQMHITDDGTKSKATQTRASDDNRPQQIVKCPPIQEMAKHGLFCPPCDVPLMSFPVLWECQRWSSSTGVALDILLQQISKKRPDLDDYAAFCRCMFNALPESCKNKAPQISARTAWQELEDPRIQYRALLTFSNSRYHPFLFQPSFHALKLEEKSCRYQRKFGSDRILYIDIPNLADLPEHFGKQWDVTEFLLEWLCSRHKFLGREWQAVHFEQNDADKSDVKRYLGSRAVLLALSGPDLEDLDVEKVIKWYMDLEGEGSKREFFRKRFSRLDLGFSRTFPTIVFKPSQVEIIPDIFATDEDEPDDFRDESLNWDDYLTHDGEEGRNMTDGCGIISVAAMKAIWSTLGRDDPLPAAMQGRIGGAKGMWVRSGASDSTAPEDQEIWIQIRKSQLKFKPCAADTDANFDPHRWTFEMANCTESKDHKSAMASLHTDMIPLLCDRGVPLENIIALVSEALVGRDGDIENILENRLDTRYWMRDHDTGGQGDRDAADDEWGVGMPFNSADKARWLIDRGFEPKRNLYLTEQVQKVAENHYSKEVKSE